MAAAGGSLAPGAGGAAAGATGMQGRGPVMGQQQQGTRGFIMSHPEQTPPHQQQFPSGQSNLVRILILITIIISTSQNFQTYHNLLCFVRQTCFYV